MSDTNQSAVPSAAPEVLPELTPEQENKETQEVVASDAHTSAEKKEEKKSNKKKYKLKIDKAEEEVELDLDNDEEVSKWLQKAKGADKRFQEAAVERKRSEEVRNAALKFIEELRTNPRRVLSDPSIGIDVKKLAEEIINEQIADAEKSPEEREREKLQKELEELKTKYQTEEETRKRVEFERLQEQQERELESGISAALDIGGVPKTPHTIKRMAEMMLIALENNIDLSPQDVVPLIKKQVQGDFSELLSSLSDDSLEDYLGKEIVTRLRKRNLAKVKQAPVTASSVKDTGGNENKKDNKKEDKRMTIKEFLNI